MSFHLQYSHFTLTNYLLYADTFQSGSLTVLFEYYCMLILNIFHFIQTKAVSYMATYWRFKHVSFPADMATAAWLNE